VASLGPAAQVLRAIAESEELQETRNSTRHLVGNGKLGSTLPFAIPDTSGFKLLVNKLEFPLTRFRLKAFSMVKGP